MVSNIEPGGRLIEACSLSGETRADDVFPAHPNGIQASANTWLLVYATRGWRAVDDDRSIVYQLRRGSPDGTLIREGMLARSQDDWDPLSDGSTLVRQHGHPVLFGVPRGAQRNGQALPHAGLFVAKWRIKAFGQLDPAAGTVSRDATIAARTQNVQWAQLRLNDAEDDIEVLQPPANLRQTGYETGERFCALEVQSANQSFTQAVPYVADGSEWVDVNHFSDSKVAALRYQYDAATGLYQWRQVGPPIGGPGGGWRHGEASIAPWQGEWVICTRASADDGSKATGWVRTADPFAAMPAPRMVGDPPTTTPRTLYRCADGVLRLFSGDPAASPYGLGRNPLYVWDIDADTFAASNRRTVFDCVTAGVLPRETDPVADMCKLLPHAGGSRQWLVWRVRTRNVIHNYADLTEGAKVASAYGFPPLRDEWKPAQGIYYGAMAFAQEYPPMWQLA